MKILNAYAGIAGNMIADAKHTFGVFGYDVSDKSSLWAKVAS